MGTIEKGILGGFSGTVGTVIGGSWKGIDYMRSRSNKQSYNATEAQLEQQAKFALVMKFCKIFSGLFMESFRNYAIKMTGVNNAFSYNIKNCVTGTYPNFSIDYTKALVSRGDLPNGGSPAATAAANSIIHFTWTDNSDMGKAAATDQTILAVYCEELNECLYVFAGTTRGTGVDDLDATTFKGKTVQTWLGFVSADGSYISNSIFTGEVTVL